MKLIRGWRGQNRKTDTFQRRTITDFQTFRSGINSINFDTLAGVRRATRVRLGTRVQAPAVFKSFKKRMTDRPPVEGSLSEREYVRFSLNHETLRNDGVSRIRTTGQISLLKSRGALRSE